jgi:hypothetical protein
MVVVMKAVRERFQMFAGTASSVRVVSRTGLAAPVQLIW